MAAHDDRQFFVSREGRELTDGEAALLRALDEEGTRLQALLARVGNIESGHYYEISQARANLQAGFMWLRRVITHTTVF